MTSEPFDPTPPSFIEDNEPEQTPQLEIIRADTERIRALTELTEATTRQGEAHTRTKITIAVVGLWMISVGTWIYLIVTNADGAAVNGVGGVAGAISVATGFVWGHYYTGGPGDPRK